ncbi:MAG: response regulator, partial [Deltaproteobacteria bacterium]
GETSMDTQATEYLEPELPRRSEVHVMWKPPVRVLLAEDDVHLRTLLRDLLRREGYLVDEASSGYDLLEQLGNAAHRRQALDLIVTDNRMRGATGLEVIEGLRESHRPGRSSTPVILITAFGDAHVHDEAARLGAVVLDKPLDLDVFLQRVAVLAGPPTS